MTDVSLRADLATPKGMVAVRVWPAGADADSRRPLVLACHDWTESGATFGPLAHALGHRWTVIAPDAPGHGATRWTPSAEYDLADHTTMIVAVLDALPTPTGGRARVVLLGHGLGGVTAAGVAAARPLTVRHLVLEEPLRTTPRRARSSLRVRERLLRLRGTAPGTVPARSSSEYEDWPSDELLAYTGAVRECDVGHLDVPVRWGEPLMATLADVRSPVTLVRGRRERGAAVSMTAAHRCASVCRAGCEVVALDAGHHPRRQARDPFIAVLAEVLGRHGG